MLGLGFPNVKAEFITVFGDNKKPILLNSKYIREIKIVEYTDDTFDLEVVTDQGLYYKMYRSDLVDVLKEYAELLQNPVNSNDDGVSQKNEDDYHKYLFELRQKLDIAGIFV